MLKLCYKDYLASRWLWLSIAVLYVLYIVQPLGQSLLVMIFGAMAVFGALAIPLIWEDQNRTEALYASLPLTRRRIVGGRYLLGGFIGLAAAALIFGMAPLTLTLLRAPAYQNALGPLLSVEAAVGYACISGFLVAGFLPFYYRLGLAKGNLAFLTGLVALGLGVAGLERLASRTLNLIPPLFTPDFFKDPGRGALGLLGVIRTALGSVLFISLTLLILAALVFVSFRLSVRTYEERDF
jgi:ABC-2 family transporter protein